MKFFSPKDFPDTGGYAYEAAAIANEKLDKLGRIVIGSPETNWDECGNKVETHKALLINIESIHQCPKEYICSCCFKIFALVEKK